MDMKDNWLLRALDAADMAIDDLADGRVFTAEALAHVAAHPGDMTVSELSFFCRAVGPAGRKVVREALLPMMVR